MNLKQLRAFSQAAERSRSRDLADFARIARAAMQAEPDALQKMLQTLGN